MAELNITEEYVNIVKNGFEAGKSDDDIIRGLFEVGVEFKDLRNIFNSVIASENLRLSAKERKEKTEEILKDWTPESSESLLSKCDELAEALGVKASKAMASIRSWAKTNKIELPKQERKPVERKAGFGGYVGKILTHVMENKDITRKEIEAHCEEQKIPAKYATLINNIVTFAREYNEVKCAEVAESSEEANEENSEAA